MTVVNIHGIKPPQRRYDLQAIAQDQPLPAYALLSQDCHMVPPVSLVKGARLWMGGPPRPAGLPRLVILAWGGVGWQAETAGSVTTTAKMLTNILCPLPSAPVHPFVQPTVHSFLSLIYLILLY